jgi:hypothetical protein
MMVDFGEADVLILQLGQAGDAFFRRKLSVFDLRKKLKQRCRVHGPFLR